jgi:protein SCO1/2
MKNNLLNALVMASLAWGIFAPPAKAQSEILRIGETVPNFTLTNQEAHKVSLQDFKGKVVLLTFLYTQCPYPDKCPMVARKLKQTKDLVDKLGDRAHFEVLAVTIDPEHDTPAVLRKYAQGLDKKMPNWDFLTGKAADVHRVASAFGVLYFDSKGTLEHNLVTAVIDREGKLVKLYGGNDWKPGEVASTLRDYLK